MMSSSCSVRQAVLEVDRDELAPEHKPVHLCVCLSRKQILQSETAIW